MTDIIDIFLSPDNVAKMDRIFATNRDKPGTPGAGAGKFYAVASQSCGMRRYMHEFIYGPYMAGLYDIWTGTDADLYIRHMNDEFIKYMNIRYNKLSSLSCPNGSGTSGIPPSDRVEIASHLDPYDMEREQRRRVEMAQPRRPITRGTGASMGGAKPSSLVEHRGNSAYGPMYDHGTLLRYAAAAAGYRGAKCADATPLHLCTPTHCSLPPQAPLTCACESRSEAGVSGAKAVQTGDRARIREPEFRAGALTDELYSRMNRDQASTVHLASRDDEASDVGHLDHTRRYAYVANCAPPPFDFRGNGCEGAREWLVNPVSESGQAQYHLLELDSRLSVLNEERTIPMGYGTTEQQLADDARVAARYVYRDGESGVIPKTSYKKLTHAIDPMGRVTLDDDYLLATDIFSRDSKGFILSGRR